MSDDNTTNVIGVELIGDLKECPSDLLQKLTSDMLKDCITTLIAKHQLSEIGSFYHQFDAGVTGIIALAESHVAFHTWGNERYVSLNVFACNYTVDNQDRARALFEDLTNLFTPQSVEVNEVIRKYK